MAEVERKRIEDVGVKIGGARKDMFSHGMSLEEFAALNPAEAALYTTKDNVWPVPDYAALIDGGMPVETAAYVKVVRDRMKAKPAVATDPGKARVDLENFVKMTQAVRDLCMKAKSVDDIGSREGFEAVLHSAGVFDRSWRYDRAALALVCSVYKDNKSPWQHRGWDDDKRVKSLVNGGFPGKAEPWLKGVSIRKIDGLYHAVKSRMLVNRQGMESEEAVSDWLKEQYAAALAAKSETRKAEPRRPHLESFDRKGLPDRRQGRHVDAEDFRAAFGFRGVEFGNWLPDDERQTVLDLGFDALHDFAEVLGLPPESVSLMGRLGLAFGARGQGGAAAHYDPTYKAVNLTRLSGGGSVAHELGHGLDHWAGDEDASESGVVRSGTGWRVATHSRVQALRNLSPAEAEAWQAVMDAMTTRPLNKDEAVKVAREELANHVKNLESNRASYEKVLADPAMARINVKYLKNIKGWIPQKEATIKRVEAKIVALERSSADADFGKTQSEYYKESVKTSGGGSGRSGGELPYWVRPTEMFARAFESMIFDKLAERGASSPYLVQGVEADRYAGDDYKGNPYPVGDERKAINAAITGLIDAMAHRLGRDMEEAPAMRS